MKTKNVSGFAVEETGGGCQWLRCEDLVITDGECGIPQGNDSCMLYDLVKGEPRNGVYFSTLDAALAYVRMTHFSR